jgi:hypothetical protein
MGSSLQGRIICLYSIKLLLRDYNDRTGVSRGKRVEVDVTVQQTIQRCWERRQAGESEWGYMACYIADNNEGAVCLVIATPVSSTAGT